MTLTNPGNRYAPSYSADIALPKYTEGDADQATSTSDISDDLIEAILAGETQITRRVEIYESDGETRWYGKSATVPSPRVIGGSVGISYGSDNRRSLDLTLDNSDGQVDHDPDGGFWYDKILKVFRGVRYQQPTRYAKVAIVTQGQADPARIGPFLGQIGIPDVTYFSSPQLSDLRDYDIVVAYGPTADFSPGVAALLWAAFNSGKSVMTFSIYATPATVPLLGTVYGPSSGGGLFFVQPPANDAPWTGAFVTYSTVISTPINSTVPLTIAPWASTGDNPSLGYFASAYAESNSGGRWFHYHPNLQLPITNQINHPNAGWYREERKYLNAAAKWLFNYKTIINWETQVGEFMLDRISQKRFPHQVSCTGRDYSKKLDKATYLVIETHPAGTSVRTILLGIFAHANITKYSIGIEDQTTNADITFDRDTTALDAINALSPAYIRGDNTPGYEWFFDKFGTLVVRDFRDPATTPALLTINNGGDDGNLIDYENSSDDTELYNHIIVRAFDTDGNLVASAEAINDDPSSPTNRARVGDRVYPYTTTLFTTNAQCQAYANSLLAVKGLEAYELDFDMLVFPWIEVGEIVELNKNDDDYPTRFLFTDGAIPLDLSPMSGTGKRVAKVTPNG